MQDRLPGAHLAIEDVDLDLTNLQNTHEGLRLPIGPTRDDEDAGKQLLGRERDRQHVVDPLIEGSQLRLEVSAPRQRQNRDALSPFALPQGELAKQTFGLEVHVHQGEVGLPLRGNGVGGLERRRCAGQELAMIQGETNQFDHERLVSQNQDAAWRARDAGNHLPRRGVERQLGMEVGES